LATDLEVVISSTDQGSNMTKPHLKPVFRQEVTVLVVDKNYSIRDGRIAII